MRLVRLLSYVLVAIPGLYFLAVVLYAIPVVSGALDDTMKVSFSRPDPSIVSDYDNGLTPAQKKTYYHLSQGSEILPWILLSAVDVADADSTKPFVENLERYGLLPDPARDAPHTTPPARTRPSRHSRRWGTSPGSTASASGSRWPPAAPTPSRRPARRRGTARSPRSRDWRVEHPP